MSDIDFAGIINFFTQVKKRPLMYISELNIEPMETLIYGFNTGCFISNKNLKGKLYFSLREQVIIERGWHLGAYPVSKEMKEKSLSTESIIEELLSIEIEAWNRMKTLAMEPD